MSRRRRNIHPYLSDQLIERFKRYAAANDATESSLVEAALTEYLDQASPKKLLLRRLNALGSQLDRVERDLAVAMEAIGAFVNIWMIHNPQPPATKEDTLRRSAAPRYAEFQRFVARQASGGRRFIDDVVQTADTPLTENAT